MSKKLMLVNTLAFVAAPLFIGAFFLLVGDPRITIYVALIGQAVGLAVGIPQWVRIVRRHSADDISILSQVLLEIMIAFLFVHAHTTHASWIVQVNFLVSLTIALVTAVLAAYYQYKGANND